ncbi:hypothetical protein Droror1_Dr00017454 [Drosera rotundifolia]
MLDGAGLGLLIAARSGTGELFGANLREIGFVVIDGFYDVLAKRLAERKVVVERLGGLVVLAESFGHAVIELEVFHKFWIFIPQDKDKVLSKSPKPHNLILSQSSTIRPTSISIPFPFHFSPKIRSGNLHRWCSINQTKEDNDAAGTNQSPRGALVVLEIRVPEVVMDEVTKVGEC